MCVVFESEHAEPNVYVYAKVREFSTTITCDRHNDDEKYNGKKHRHKKGNTGSKTTRNECAHARTQKKKPKRNNKNNSNKNEKQWKNFAVIYLCMRY